MQADQRAPAMRHAWAAFLLVVALVLGSTAVPAQAVDPTATPDPSALQQKLKDLRGRAAEQS